MKLARRAIDDPERILELEASLDDRVSELLGEANDAGYSTEEASQALLKVVRNQVMISQNGADPANEPPSDINLNGDPHSLDRRPS